MYYVFDCSKEVGYTVALPWSWLANITAIVLTACTGRTHDFDTI